MVDTFGQTHRQARRLSMQQNPVDGAIHTRRGIAPRSTSIYVGADIPNGVVPRHACNRAGNRDGVSARRPASLLRRMEAVNQPARTV